MKPLLLIALISVAAISSFGQAPAPIVAADIPNSVSVPVSNAEKVGAARAYNAAVAEAYAKHIVTTAPGTPFPTPATPTGYLRARLGDVLVHYRVKAETDEVTALKIELKFPQLSPARQAAIKAELDAIP